MRYPSLTFASSHASSCVIFLTTSYRLVLSSSYLRIIFVPRWRYILHRSSHTFALFSHLCAIFFLTHRAVLFLCIAPSFSSLGHVADFRGSPLYRTRCGSPSPRMTSLTAPRDVTSPRALLPLTWLELKLFLLVLNQWSIELQLLCVYI